MLWIKYSALTVYLQPLLNSEYVLNNFKSFLTELDTFCLQNSFESFFFLCRRRGNCKKAGLGLVCEVGLRCRTYYVLCGSVLSVWTKVEGVLASVSGTNVKMQIVRLRTEDGQRIVGKWLVCSFISI